MATVLINPHNTLMGLENHHGNKSLAMFVGLCRVG